MTGNAVLIEATALKRMIIFDPFVKLPLKDPYWVVTFVDGIGLMSVGVVVVLVPKRTAIWLNFWVEELYENTYVLMLAVVVILENIREGHQSVGVKLGFYL